MEQRGQVPFVEAQAEQRDGEVRRDLAHAWRELEAIDDLLDEAGEPADTSRLTRVMNAIGHPEERALADELAEALRGRIQHYFRATDAQAMRMEPALARHHERRSREA